MTAQQIKTMGELNRTQLYLDALVRRRRYIKHLAFCEWWKDRSLQGDTQPLSRQRSALARHRGRRLMTQLKTVQAIMADANAHIDSLIKANQKAGPFKREKYRNFFSHTDVCVAFRDMGSAWPAAWSEDPTQPSEKAFDDWLAHEAPDLKNWVYSLASSPPDKQVAAPSGIAAKTKVKESAEWLARNKALAKLPEKYRNAVYNTTVAMLSGIPADHALIKNPSPAESVWAGQPWLPLFIEWEIEYVHIPRYFWELRHDDAGTGHYGIRPGCLLAEFSAEFPSRQLSGRALLLPHMNEVIKGMMKMLYGKQSPKALEQGGYLPARAAAEKFLQDIDIVFARLDGLTDHLLTLAQGVHAVPLSNSIQEKDGIFPNVEDLKLLYDESSDASANPMGSHGGLDVTPYGNSHDELTIAASREVQQPQKKDMFFHPVTHGQARITQLKLVDRFGQVVCGVDPRPEQAAPGRGLYPHVSRRLMCEPCPPLNEWADEWEKQPNTVRARAAHEVFGDDCPWFQLPPRINQDARL